MSKNRVDLLSQIVSEIELRIESWETEKARLINAPLRIPELDDLIANARQELSEMKVKFNSEKGKLP